MLHGKCIFSQSGALDFQNILGEHCLLHRGGGGRKGIFVTRDLQFVLRDLKKYHSVNRD